MTVIAPATTSYYERAVQADRPAGYWRMQDTGGSVLEDAVKVPRRTLIGSPQLVTPNDGNMNGWGAMTLMPDGRLLITFARAAHFTSTNFKTAAVTGTHSGGTWSFGALRWLDEPDAAGLTNYGGWPYTLDDGTILLTFWGLDQNYTPARQTVWSMRSTDLGDTWADLVNIPTSGFGSGNGAADAKPLQLADGTILRTMYGNDLGAMGDDDPSALYVRIAKSTDRGMSWTDTGVAIGRDIRPNESQIIYAPDGRLACYMRCWPETTYPRSIAVSFSEDDGATWTEPEIIIANAHARPAVILTPDDDVWMGSRVVSGNPVGYQAPGFAVGSYDGYRFGTDTPLLAVPPLVAGQNTNNYCDFEYVGNPDTDGALVMMWAEGNANVYGDARNNIFFQTWTRPQPAGCTPLTLTGAPTFGEPSPIESDDDARSIRFDGTIRAESTGPTQWPLTIAAATPYSLGRYTLACWIRPMAAASLMNALGSHSGGIGFHASTSLMYTRAWMTPQLLAGGRALNQWYYLTATFDQGDVRLYVNDNPAPVATTTVTAAMPGLLSAFGLAMNVPANSPFNGRLAEAAFFARVLTPAQIGAHYRAAIEGEPTITVLNEADAVYLGADAVDAVYVGDHQVWPPVVGPDPYVDEVMADTPTGFWLLNETSGTIAEDSSGNNHHGTYEDNARLGVVAPNGRLAMAKGRTYNGVLIPGSSNGRAEIPSDPALWPLAEGTYELVHYPTGADQTGVPLPVESYHGVIGKWETAMWPNTLEWSMNAHTPAEPHVRFGSATMMSWSTVVLTETWYHLAITWTTISGNNREFRFYIDGQLIGAQTQTAAVTGNAAPLRIGMARSPTAGEPLVGAGLYMFAAVYGHALSDTRIQAHYDAL